MRRIPRFCSRRSFSMTLLGCSIGLLAAGSAHAAFTFEIVANRDSGVPASAETFNVFGLPALEGENLAFSAIDSAGVRGIFKRVGGTLLLVADTNTTIPEGAGNFIDFDNPSLDATLVAFRAEGISGQSGIYTDSGGLTRVADESTIVPGFGGTYSSFGLFPSMDAGRVAFSSIGAVIGERGIYVWDGGLSTVVDTDDPIPGGVGDFTSFFDPSLDDGSSAFVGRGSSQEGIYRHDAGGNSLIADRDTLQPGEAEDFGDFAGFAVLSGQTVGFMGVSGVPTRGVYRGNGSLISVADTNDAIPEGAGNFTTLAFSNDVGPSLVCAATVFIAQGSSSQKGIYTNIGGSLVKVVDVDDSLGGVDVDNVFLSREGFSGNRIAFGVNEPGGSSTSVDAIWIATSDIDPCTGEPLDLPALAPGAQLLLVALLAGTALAVAGLRSACTGVR